MKAIIIEAKVRQIEARRAALVARIGELRAEREGAAFDEDAARTERLAGELATAERERD